MIKVWEDMRQGFITNVSIDPHPVISRLVWNTMMRRRNLEQTEGDRRKIVESAIIKQTSKGLAEGKALKLEDQFDERESVGSWKRLQKKPKGL